MKDTGKIYIAPLNFKDMELFNSLSSELTITFVFSCVFLPLDADLFFAFNPERNQYHSSKIIQRFGSEMPANGVRILIVVNVDLYVPELNFVFGEAEIGGPAAIISVTRLRPEFYKMKPDRTLYIERAIKEAVHELGHTFGLSHCPNSSCVMYFSNSLMDTDYKLSVFCSECIRMLRKSL